MNWHSKNEDPLQEWLRKNTFSDIPVSLTSEVQDGGGGMNVLQFHHLLEDVSMDLPRSNFDSFDELYDVNEMNIGKWTFIKYLIQEL